MSEMPGIEQPIPTELCQSVFNGLGLCLNCVGDHLAKVRGERNRASEDNGSQPEFYNPSAEELLATGEVNWGITLVPNWQQQVVPVPGLPPGQGQLMIALTSVPTCSAHIQIGLPPKPPSSLIVPGPMGGLG